MTVDGLQHAGAARRCTGGFRRPHPETGSAANLTLDSRTSYLVEARLQLERGLADRATAGGTLMSGLRFGVDAQYLKGDDVTLSAGSGTSTFTPGGDGAAGRAFVGLDMRHLSTDGNRELRGGVELGQSTEGMTDLSATLRRDVSF